MCLAPDKGRAKLGQHPVTVKVGMERNTNCHPLLFLVLPQPASPVGWEKPSSHPPKLLKPQNQCLPFYKHWFLILFRQISKDLLQKIRETVLQKTVDGMRKEGVPYLGTYKTLGFLTIRRTTFYFAFSSFQPNSHWKLRETALIYWELGLVSVA